MVTLPAAPSPEPHQHRTIAESFGVDPQRYDRARLAYPDVLITRIVDGSPGRDMLDVGCGTGIEARQFREAGCRVLGVEPDQRMAEFARQTGIDVEVSRIEDWDPAGRTFDAVVAGTAWHWVDPALGTAKAASVLRPGGRIALFWHTFELPQPIAAALADVYHRVVPDSPISFNPSLQGVKLYQPGFTRAAEALRATGEFTPAEQWQFDWQHTYTRDAWLDQLPTTGGMTRLSPAQQSEILSETARAIDALGGTFLMPYATVAVTATKTTL